MLLIPIFPPTSSISDGDVEFIPTFPVEVIATLISFEGAVLIFTLYQAPPPILRFVSSSTIANVLGVESLGLKILKPLCVVDEVASPATIPPNTCSLLTGFVVPIPTSP